MNVDNAVGGSNATLFHYENGLYNTQGRGFLGFVAIESEDVSAGVITRTEFNQRYPFTSTIRRQTKRLSTNESIVFEEVDYDWRKNEAHYARYNTTQTNTVWDPETGERYEQYLGRMTGPQLTYLKSSTTRKYPLDGSAALISESRKETTEIDQFNNVISGFREETDYLDFSPTKYRVETTAIFSPDESVWWLDRRDSISTAYLPVVRGADDPLEGDDALDPEQTVTVSVQDWDSLHRKPAQTMTDATSLARPKTVQFFYNVYGLPETTIERGDTWSGSGWGIQERQTTYQYSSDGFFPEQICNAMGHCVTSDYDHRFGIPIEVTDPNGWTVTTLLDGLGRELEVRSSALPTKFTRYRKAPSDVDAPVTALTSVQHWQAGTPSSKTFFNSWGQPVRVIADGFDGRPIYRDKLYNERGLTVSESEPYYFGEDNGATTWSGYDALGRPGSKLSPWGLLTNYQYAGLTTNIDHGGLSASRTYSAQGWLLSTTDAQGHRNRFAYSAAGHPLVIEDANGSQIRASYDGMGQKLSVLDPNQGITQFGFNAFGEAVYQKDANDTVKYTDIDKLGRAKRVQTTADGDTTSAYYTFDSAYKGLMDAETENGIKRQYLYDELGRLRQLAVEQDNQRFTVQHQYDDNYGRAKALVYPGQLTLAYEYTDTGFLSRSYNAASNYTYRRFTEMDARGNWLEARLGDAAITENRAYDRFSNVMLQASSDSAGAVLHRINYEHYDQFLNLKQASHYESSVSTLVKSFDYDHLHRLVDYQLNGSSVVNVNYDYDAIGNFVSKSDYAQVYEYGDHGPNAVSRIQKLDGSWIDFGYDGRGNMTSSDGLSLKYNANDKPTLITGRGTTTELTYGANGMRHKQKRTTNSGVTTTYYLDKLFELDRETQSWRAYIDDVAVVSWDPELQHSIRFTLKDRLGSAVATADHNGSVTSRRYFDPFGRTGDAGAVAGSSESKLKPVLSGRYRRGFTDHEHLDEQQLIHMNGRVYDYNLGRFLSVDPFIQAPTSTQSINPYSYIMNNPMAGTDPTGYVGVGTPENHTQNEPPRKKDRKDKKKERQRYKRGGNGWATVYASSNGAESAQSTSAKKSDGTSEDNSGTNQDNSGFGVDDAASIGVGFTPAGVVADVYTAGTGEDFFTGEEVSGFWRWAGLIPFVSEARKLGNAADAAQEGITAIRKGSDIADSAFGQAIQGASRKTKLQYQGQSIHEVTKNTKLDGFKLRKGDHYYVDGLHKDHIEVFDSRGKARGVLNLDGTFNADKSKKAMSRSIEKLLR